VYKCSDDYDCEGEFVEGYVYIDSDTNIVFETLSEKYLWQLNDVEKLLTDDIIFCSEGCFKEWVKKKIFKF